MRVANIWPETPGCAEEPQLADAGPHAGRELAAPQPTPEERPWWHRITTVTALRLAADDRREAGRIG